ncbi:MAG: sigma-54 dependent transcriptional regulator [Spirochaetia bacterium]|jgi:two-component system nitrogen regulation response regulator NtrX|nr:sigma-54 dependent transcriptional regulator [Spirochaetia bacterium]
MIKILIIDDEENIREVLSGILEDEGYAAESAKDGLEGLSKAEKGDFDLVILDVWLPGMGGMEVLDKLKISKPDLEVVVISGHGNIDMAVKAVKKGAFDFLEKPLSLDKVITVVKNALTLEKLRKENRELKDSLFIEDRMTGSGPEMEKIWKIIDQVAASDVSVMILGENGTGKELVAREIHTRSNRKDFPFIEVNCASIPDTLIESELFGHEKGSFTGAVAGRRGKFEMADKGTLFLDEIADMSLNAQAKVLRAIQEMRFERVGSEKSTQVNVRILAATNRDIFTEVKNGRFREDLYFRLNVIPVNLPPLRERKNDIPELVDYFLKKYNKNDKSISPEGIAFMKEYQWPGNIRELKNFIQRISVMTDESVVSAETVGFYLGESDLALLSGEKPDSGGQIGGIDAELNLNDAKEQFEKKFLVSKLEKNSYNLTRTAQDLGMYPGNLHQKLKKLGITLK